MSQLKCPKCKARIKEDMDACPRCGLPLIITDKTNYVEPIPISRLFLRVLMFFIGLLVTVCIFTFIGVRIYYSQEAKRVQKEYVNHTVQTITLDNGMTGHAINFFGNDGDTLYIEELHESYMFVGGVAHVEFADYIWFEDDPSDIESAMITLSPVLITSSREKIKLPAFSMSIPVPEAPVVINTPTTDYNTVITSLASIDMDVVYGSQVIINGEDVSDKMDRNGGLSLVINIYPIGDNNISIIVRTDKHKEARRDLVFFRDKMDINLELNTSVSFKSTLNYMTVSGRTDPGAWIEIDTLHDSSSVKVDQQTGEFSFKARFSSYGENLVKFRATMPGKKDSEISFFVNYIPAKAEYSRNAWAMDYQQLRLIYEQWTGRVFLCKGRIVDMYYENGIQYSVMDVGENEEQLIILENQSDVGSLNIGARYEVYADVAGRLFYDTSYCPHLVARYASLVVTK